MNGSGATGPRPELSDCVELFNAGRYHDAHEAFEELWLAGEGADADLYKGLIQASICLHHLAQGNLAGARSLYRGHRRYLAAYQEDGRGLDVARFLADMQAFLRPVLRAAEGETVPFDAARAPRLHPSSAGDDGSSPPPSSSSSPSM
jgi:predicted metal-dependent hydrolase